MSTTWRCGICGYVHRADAPPACCPVCGAAQGDFEQVTDAPLPAAALAARWRCLNCNYIHEGFAPPDACPVCGAPRDRFEPVEDAPASAAAMFDGHAVVIGAGIAGIAAVEAFRRAAPRGTITLLAGESALPYYRLNLTRYLAGELGATDLPIHDAAWYARQNIDLRLGAETSEIDPAGRTVRLGSGEVLSYDRLLLAAGAHAFLPAVPGMQLGNVFTLRTVRDADGILAVLQPGMRCVCIGGGLLGLETAGALAARQAQVTLLEGHGWLMPRQLNQRAGEVLAHHVACVGVAVRRNARTQAIVGADQVHGVMLADGAFLPADLVVVATGVRPNSHLGRRVGLEVNNGIVVDSHLATSHPQVFAAGDVAEHRGLLYGSWSASQYQGGIAGLNLAGVPTEFGGLPRTHTLKVLGVDMMSIGMVEPTDGSFTVLENEETGGFYRRFVMHDNLLVGAVLIGDTAQAARIKHAIEHRRAASDILPLLR